MLDFPIDFVVPWVDDSDKRWCDKRRGFAPVDEQMNSDARFRDYGIFKFLFRSVAKNAPWVNKIYVLTDSQVPVWLAEHPKVVVVDHKRFIPEQYLPTFNSNVIESNIHRIAGLSEHFVLFNDDFFVLNSVEPADFFAPDGRPKDVFALNVIQPTDHYSHIFVQNLSLINAHYNKYDVIKKRPWLFFNYRYGALLALNLYLSPFKTFTRFYDPHLATAFTKHDLARMWSMFGGELTIFQKNRFRQPDDYSIYLARYIRLVEGDFVPTSMKNFGTYLPISDLRRVTKNLLSELKILVLNDDEHVTQAEFEVIKPAVIKLLKQRFPGKSVFER